MQEALQETMPIADTYNGFKNWLSSFFMALDPEFRSHFSATDYFLPNREGDASTEWIYFGKMINGEISFELKVEGPELLTLTAMAYNERITGSDGRFHPVFKDDVPQPLSEYFKYLTDAIRTKYALGQPSAKATNPPTAQRHVKRIVEQGDTAPFNKLSDREREVADLIADEFTQKQIAKWLMISEGTVNSHSDHIAEKLGIKGKRSSALRKMIERTG